MEIWIGSCPDVVGGAATENLHSIALLRQFGVNVHVVPFCQMSGDVYKWCGYKDVKVHEYRPGIFADKIVAHWCDVPLLARLAEIVTTGRPRCLIHFPCMTTLLPLHKAAHRCGWIDRWGWVSEYQRGVLEPQLAGAGKNAPPFYDYRPYFDANLHLQQLPAGYAPPKHEFVVGRISRDDPDKFSDDTWEIFSCIDTGNLIKRVRVLGFGPRTEKKIGLPAGEEHPGLAKTIVGEHVIIELWAPGGMSSLAFYSGLHCILHKTGGSRESFGRFAIEAMFAGVPVIVERAYAFPEFITHGETGFLCDSSEEMIETASMLAKDEKRRKSIIHAARDDVKRLCRPEKCWRPWKTLLESMG